MPRSILRDPANRRPAKLAATPLGLGYRGHPGWRDMSEFVVHFTKRNSPLSESEVLHKILAEGQLVPGPKPFGAAHKLGALGDSQRSVCFSEIPLDMLERLVERRSRYGIGFRKDFVGCAGGAPVWYLQRGTPLAQLFFEMSKADSPFDYDNPIWMLTPFVDYPGDYPKSEYRFEWEREWRVPRPLPFQPQDISFLFVPETDHAELRAAVPNVTCPLVDTQWDEQAMQHALASAG